MGKRGTNMKIQDAINYEHAERLRKIESRILWLEEKHTQRTPKTQEWQTITQDIKKIIQPKLTKQELQEISTLLNTLQEYIKQSEVIR
jgi:glutaredoxin 2